MNESKVFDQFAKAAELEFAINGISVYKDGQHIYGKELDEAYIEKCLSLFCTSVFKSASGCTLVTQLHHNSSVYIIALSSADPDTFNGKEAEFIITDIKKLSGRLGDS